MRSHFPGVAFLFWVERGNMAEAKSIYCPRCGAKVLTYDGRTTMLLANDCKECHIRVTYNPTTDEITKGYIPQRKTSSGCQF